MLKNRLFVQIMIAILFGISIGTAFPLPTVLTIISTALLLLFLILSAVLYKKRKITSKSLFIFSLIICFFAGYSYSSNYCNFRFSDKVLVSEHDKIYDVEAVITDKNSKYTDLKVVSGDVPKGLYIRVYNLEYDELNLKTEPFQKGKFSLTLSSCPDYIKADGISFYGQGNVYETEKYNGYYVKKAAYQTKTYLSEKVRTRFSENPDTAAFINAIILGDTAELSDGIYSDYGRLGITHIISVSGLHFAIIVMSLLKVLQMLNVKLKMRSFLCIPFAIFYCLLTGSSPSALRALIMITIFLFGRIILWDMDSLTSIFTAALIICVFNPYSIYSTSFALSFLATFAIIISPSFLGIEDLYHKPKHIKRINKIVQSLFITLIISLYITPVLYDRFQTLSLITPIANLLLSVFFTLLMYVSLLCVVISPFNVPEFLTKAVNFFIDGFHDLIHNFASLKGICIAPSNVLIHIIFILAIICTFATFFLKKKPREITVRITVMLSVLFVAFSVIITSFYTNKYNRIICSKNGETLLWVSNGEIHYFVENEKCIDSDFIISNDYLDISSLVIMDVTDRKYANKCINKFTDVCKVDIIYANENVDIEDKTEIKVLNECHFLNEDVWNENAVIVDEVLWLSDKSKNYDCNLEFEKVIISLSFIRNKTNVRYLPDRAKEIYIPEGFDEHYIIKYIEKNYIDSKIFYIEDFEYKKIN